MKRPLLWFLLALVVAGNSVWASDLPTITVEHLYYLRTRSQFITKLRIDEMIEYCVAQKLGNRAFEDLYVQIFMTKSELTRLQNVEGVAADDPRVKTLTKTRDAYLALLREEAQKIQNGLVREGQIASNTLDAIARDQK